MDGVGKPAALNFKHTRKDHDLFGGPEEGRRRTRYKSGYLVAILSSIAMWIGILVAISGLLSKLLR